MKKEESNFKIEDLFVGKILINRKTEEEAIITKLSPNSIQVYNKASIKFKDKDGKLKGINSTNWYELSWFNRTFKDCTLKNLSL